jgi:dUTP pyrophosphatase
MSNSTTSRPLIGLVRLPHGEGLALPAYETAGSAGMDIRAAVPADKPLVIKPGKRALVPTGFVFEIPPGYEVQVRPRSGLALKNGVTCLNTPGTVDSDYRGEVQVLLINHGQAPFVIKRGDRIAQMVVAPVTQIAWNVVEQLDQTERGSGGYGSTGIAAVAQ